jgi:ribonuclease HII
MRPVDVCKQKIVELERKHGMSFEQFTRHTSERTARLRDSTNLSPDERRILSEEIMRDEEDWLDWKAAEEMLQSWLQSERSEQAALHSTL